jgi:hypothetical protein
MPHNLTYEMQDSIRFDRARNSNCHELFFSKGIVCSGLFMAIPKKRVTFSECEE